MYWSIAWDMKIIGSAKSGLLYCVIPHRKRCYLIDKNRDFETYYLRTSPIKIGSIISDVPVSAWRILQSVQTPLRAPI